MEHQIIKATHSTKRGPKVFNAIEIEVLDSLRVFSESFSPSAFTAASQQVCSRLSELGE